MVFRDLPTSTTRVFEHGASTMRPLLQLSRRRSHGKVIYIPFDMDPMDLG
jgi:hypothetical protein